MLWCIHTKKVICSRESHNKIFCKNLSLTCLRDLSRVVPVVIQRSCSCYLMLHHSQYKRLLVIQCVLLTWLMQITCSFSHNGCSLPSLSSILHTGKMKEAWVFLSASNQILLSFRSRPYFIHLALHHVYCMLFFFSRFPPLVSYDPISHSHWL